MSCGVYRIESISRKIRYELWTLYPHFQWEMEWTVVLCSQRCPVAFEDFKDSPSLLEYGLMCCEGQGQEWGRPFNWEFIILSFYRLPLPPHHCPTPLPHTLGCEVTAGNSYPLCTPMLLTFLCEVCQLCANDAEARSSGSRVEVEETGKGWEVKSKGMSILPFLLSLHLKTEGLPLFLSAFVLVIQLFMRIINSTSQIFLLGSVL